jgi:hypothetical protein
VLVLVVTVTSMSSHVGCAHHHPQGLVIELVDNPEPARAALPVYAHRPASPVAEVRTHAHGHILVLYHLQRTTRGDKYLVSVA